MKPNRRDVLGSGVALSAAGLLPSRAVAADAPIVSKIALTENRVWIAAMIEKSGPHLFIIDTGGTVSLIDDALAKRLKLESGGRSNLVGVGGVSNKPWYRADHVTLGNGMRFTPMLFAGTDARFGTDAVGAFGAGLFTTYDSDLDFAKGEWRTWTKGRPDFAGMRQIPSRFSRNKMGGERIYADATIGGFAGEYLVDTGAPAQIYLDGKASAQSGFWSADRPYAPTQGRGIGKGRVPSRIVRMDRLKIGPYVFERPLAVLREPGTPSVDGEGVIGLSILSRMNLSTQVSSRTVWAAPNGLPQAEDYYSRSGLWVDQRGDSIIVSDVGTGSPAAAAGLKPDDVIVGLPWNGVLARAGSRTGTRIRLDYERGGKRASAEFVTADYL
jgi:hypothetical protein